MSFSNHRWFQFSNHRWFQFWHVSGCDLGASTLKGTESYTYSIGRWSTKHKFGAAHLARESSTANWTQTLEVLFRLPKSQVISKSPVINPPSTRDGDGGFITGDFKAHVISIFTVISRKNHRWFLLPPPVRKYNSKCQPPVIWYMKQKDHNESLSCTQTWCTHTVPRYTY